MAREREVEGTVPSSMAKPERTEKRLLLGSLGKLGIVFEDNVSVFGILPSNPEHTKRFKGHSISVSVKEHQSHRFCYWQDRKCIIREENVFHGRTTWPGGGSGKLTDSN